MIREEKKEQVVLQCLKEVLNLYFQDGRSFSVGVRIDSEMSPEILDSWLDDTKALLLTPQQREASHPVSLHMHCPSFIFDWFSELDDQLKLQRKDIFHRE